MKHQRVAGQLGGRSPSQRLRHAVRQGLTLGAGVVATGAAVCGVVAEAQPFPTVFELSSLDGTNGFVIRGIDANDLAGYAASAAGDVNGDGVDDLLIGAAQGDPNGHSNAGESYVVFGGAKVGASGSIELSGLDGGNGFVLNGIRVEDFSGLAVSGAGDVDGDGFDDVIVGALGADPNRRYLAGQSYVVFGAPAVGAEGTVELSSLDGLTGFALNGTHIRGESGSAVSRAGDVNGDGYDDVLIGAVWADPGGRFDAGQSYVVFGGANAGANDGLELVLLNGSNGFVINGIDVGDNSGRAVGAAGDVNGDGFDDVLIGATHADPGGRSDAGEVYVVFGRPGPFAPQLELSSLDGMNGSVIEGADAYGLCGISVSGTGDVNDDGFDDIVMGAVRAQPQGTYDAGNSYVVFGGPQVGSSGVLELSALDGENGFVLNGIDARDESGWQVSRAGDLNGDGIADLVIAAAYADPGGRSDAGEVYVIYGRPDLGNGGSFELSALDGENGFMIAGIDAGDHAGRAATAAGDINGDGIDDLLIGAYLADPNGVSAAGETYVVFGRALDTDADGVADRADNCTLLANADQRDTNSDGFGNACDPDLNNDGVINFSDLGLLRAVFFSTDPDADFDGNGVVSFADLGTMKQLFFQPPGPSGLSE